jgi:hypothetical protein
VLKNGLCPFRTTSSFSASERLTLRYIAEGELHPRELDWVALQRLKQACSKTQRIVLASAEGRRALHRVLAGH